MINATDWKTKVASIILAIATAAYAIDFSVDSTKTIIIKIVIAAAGALLGVGAADKVQKVVTATKENTAAQFLIAGKSEPIAIPTPAEREVLAKFGKV